MPTPVHATASVLLVAVLIGLPGTTVAQNPPGAPELPRSPDDRPDLHGVWYFNTTTPLQRPERLGDKTRYTEEEHAALAARSAEVRPFDAHPPAGSVGAYNQILVGPWRSGRRSADLAHRRPGQREAPAPHTGGDPTGRLDRATCPRTRDCPKTC